MSRSGVIEVLLPICQKTRESSYIQHDRNLIDSLASFRAAIKEGCDGIESGESPSTACASADGRRSRYFRRGGTHVPRPYPRQDDYRYWNNQDTTLEEWGGVS
jgi:hypothetical protein